MKHYGPLQHQPGDSTPEQIAEAEAVLSAAEAVVERLQDAQSQISPEVERLCELRAAGVTGPELDEAQAASSAVVRRNRDELFRAFDAQSAARKRLQALQAATPEGRQRAQAQAEHDHFHRRRGTSPAPRYGDAEWCRLQD